MWKIVIEGHDELEPQHQETQQKGLVAKAQAFVSDIQANAGIIVDSATCQTEATGTVDVTEH